jgi:chloramphenicol-sensitive protein RarD
MQEDRSGLAIGLTAYLLWGFLTVYWKALHHFDAIELIGHRILWSSVLLALVLGASGRWRAVFGALRNKQEAGAMALASVLLAANWTSYVYAVVHGHVVETALGYFIAPIGTMLVGVFALGETLRARQWFALALSSAAVVILTVSYGRVPWLALVMASTWCTYGYLKRKVRLGPIESLAGEAWLLAIPAAVLVAVRSSGGQGIVSTASSRDIVLVLLSGVVTAVPLVLFAHAAKRLPFTVLGPLQYLVPSINFLLGVFAYHEHVDGTRIFGFSLVWAALVVLALDSLTGRVRSSRLVEAA